MNEPATRRTWNGQNVYRCDWCGRFYSSPLPEASACPEHAYQASEKLLRGIDQFNERLRKREALLQQEGTT